MNTNLTLLIGGLLVAFSHEIRSALAQAAVEKEASVRSAVAQTPQYTVIDLGTLKGKSYARDINEQGQVVGVSQNDSGFYHAFLYSEGVMQDLGTLGNEHSEALGMNDSGQVVGVVWNDDFSVFHAFLYSNGSMKDLGTLGGKYSAARGINNAGHVVGWSRIGDALGSNRAFRYSDGAMRSLGRLSGGSDSEAYGINDSGEVVGESSTFGFGRYRAFLYSDGLMQNLGTLTGLDSQANGINNLGEVVGEATVDSFGSTQAFFYSDGSMQKLKTLGGGSSSAYAINDAGQVVGSLKIAGETHAFLYSDGDMLDLNNLIDPASGWRLMKASAINNAGQIVGDGRNPSGQERGFLLNPLLSVTPEWQQVIETNPRWPTYGEPPKKELGKDSLIVVTHGWQPAFLPVDILWVDTMTNVISRYLINQGLTEWQVHAHRWVEKATVSIKAGGPQTALRNAKQEGVSLGRYIAGQRFGDVHFIAHSAGAGLIQAASETIKSLRSGIVVHLTFLDAFVGFSYEESDTYGKGADWSDSYFSRDFETSGGIFPFTESSLDHAYNVDVTWLDPSREEVTVVYSTPSGDVSQTCYQKITSHGWPYLLYTDTVPPNGVLGSEGFGFLLSKEGGNWDFATNAYRVGRSALKVLGNGELSCVQNPSTDVLHTEPSLDFSKLPSASVLMSSPEHVNIRGVDFTLQTASPAWLAVAIPLTNKVNFVFIEAWFTGARGSEGLLSVYWGTNVIGSVDERVAMPGARKYSFPLPETVSSGTRMLGFRLDAFSAIQSSVIVTNVALGFVGVRDPFSLSFTGTNVNGMPILQLTGPSGFNYRVETSTNLVDWATMAILVNTNEIVRFADPSLTKNATTRFYRAVAP